MTEPFDVCGPLPTGVTVLEASAGTGKTFTIAALAARYVAEGVPLRPAPAGHVHPHGDRRAARARPRAAGQRGARARARAGRRGRPARRRGRRSCSPTAARPWSRLRRERLAAALADFDAATIATTHGFCQEVLGGLGVLGDIEADTTFVEDVDRPRRRGRRRPLRASSSRGAGRREFSRAEALAIARTAIDNPAAPIEPADAPDDTIAAMRVRLAGAARDELDARKRRTGVMTYDDLLTRLHATLVGESGDGGRARLRARYRVVLVDEFQDTDPVQWEIMRTAFGDGEATLVLIGDPKQAIYAFRGADVYAYLEAARTAGTAGHAHGQLAQRPGADRRLRRAVRRREARARGDRLPPGQRGRTSGARLHGAPDPAPLRIRVVPRDERRPDAPRASRCWIRRASTSPATSPPTSSRCSAPAPRSSTRDGAAIRSPGHIAVLVRTNRTAALVRDALRRGRTSPPSSTAPAACSAPTPAREWLRLLEAIERPSYPPARALGRADHVPRLDDRAGRRRRRRRVGGGAQPPAPLGAACSARRASRRSWRRSRSRRACRRECSRWSTASGG